MKYICHRVNKIDELINIPKEYGVEIDLRDNLSGRIYIEHNPFQEGEDFEEYLKNYCNGTMILNIKSERIEFKVLELLSKYDIKDYFFLDCSFPMIYSLTQKGVRNIALRLSEYEKMDTIIAMAGKLDWVWIDCFSKIPVKKNDLKWLKELGFQTCFVSPELQGRPEDLERYITQIKNEELYFDAICTKNYNIDKWQSLENYEHDV